MPTKLYKYEVSMTVLTDRPIPDDMGPGDIWDECMTGDFVGSWDIDGDEINGQDMVRLMNEAGSEAAFFELNEDGTFMDSEE